MKWISVTSSNLDAVAYDKTTNQAKLYTSALKAVGPMHMPVSQSTFIKA